MNHTLVYHLSVIEALWVMVSLTGLIFTAINTKHAWRDYNHIKRSNIFNGRRTVGRTAAWTELMRTIVQVIFVSIGIGAGTIPDAPIPNAFLNIQIVQATIRWGLISASIFITLQSYLLSRMRSRINHMGPPPPLERTASGVEKLVEYADEAEARRIAGSRPESDVTREEP